MAILILMIGGFLTLMDLLMPSLMTKVNGMIPMMTATETISNISMGKPGEKHGEEMAALPLKVTQRWTAGAVQIQTAMVGQTLLLIG